MEYKTVDEVCALLKARGFDDAVLQEFRDEDMDGEAVCAALASCPGADCLKDIIKKAGPRLRVYSALRTICQEEEPNDLPSPFPIPAFRRSTTKNLEKDVLTDPDCRYMVQTIATVLMTYVQRPSLDHCKAVANSVIDKYPLVKDSIGEGEHSWKWYLYNRCQNVNREVTKQESEDGGACRKSIKLTSKNKHAYPCIPDNADDEASFGKHLDMLTSELAKPAHRQSSSHLQELMRRTFAMRRQWILEDHDDADGPVRQIITKYPLLTKATYVSQEFSQILQRNMRESFDAELLDWARAVIAYTKETQPTNTQLKKVVSGIEESHPVTCVKVSLKCLFLLFASKKDKKDIHYEDEDIPFLLRIVPRGTPPAEACDKTNSQPHMVYFCDVNDGSDDLAAQFFIAIEQQLMMETSNIFAAVFYLMASHYVFNLSYHNKINYVLLFLQEKVLDLPSSTVKRTPTALTHFSGIALFRQKVDSMDHTENIMEEDDEIANSGSEDDY